MTETLYNRVAKIIAEQMNVDISDITPDKRLKEDLGADSIEMVELIMAFEEEFGQNMPDEEVADVTTVSDIVEYIDRQQNM